MKPKGFLDALSEMVLALPLLVMWSRTISITADA